MTHDRSAVLAQLDALKSADGGAVFVELIRARLPARIQAEATEGHRHRSVSTFGITTVRLRGTRLVVQWVCCTIR